MVLVGILVGTVGVANADYPQHVKDALAVKEWTGTLTRRTVDAQATGSSTCTWRHRSGVQVKLKLTFDCMNGEGKRLRGTGKVLTDSDEEQIVVLTGAGSRSQLTETQKAQKNVDGDLELLDPGEWDVRVHRWLDRGPAGEEAHQARDEPGADER